MEIFDSDYEMIKTVDGLEACYYTNSSSSNSVWKNNIPLQIYLPLFLMQLTIVLFMNHLVIAVAKRLHQPSIVGQLIMGVLLGPTIIRSTEFFEKYVFPYKTAIVLETFANLGVVFNMFLVGLEMDIKLILRSEAKVLSVAFAGILVPMAAGFGLFLLAVGPSEDLSARSYIFGAIALTATNFPEVTEILANLKLLRLDIGKTALCSSLISDLCTWMLLAVAILVQSAGKYYALLCTVGFILFCILALRPALSLIFHDAVKSGNVPDSQVWFVMAGILLCGFITDVCGAHSAIGALILGVIMPQGQIIRSTFREKINDFIFGTAMPLFFLTTGLKCDIVLMFSQTSWTILLLVLVSSCLCKIVSTFLITFHYRVPAKEGLALGLIMNSKGVLALLVLNTGRSIQALSNRSYALMMLAVLVMACLIEPILAATYKPTNHAGQYKHRTIHTGKQDGELRILACICSIRNMSGMINLLKFSNATAESPIHVFAVHLVELIENTTPMLIMHEGGKSMGQEEAEQFKKSFENYEKTSDEVTVQTVTSVSPNETMHELICGLAEDKRSAFIIIPFPRQLTANDDGMENYATAFASVCKNVLAKRPCSVGIFVDRGLGSTSKHRKSQHFFMLFMGGPNDREALAYAWRMAGHPKVKLTLVRFLLGKDVSRLRHQEQATSDYEKEKQMDDEDIYEFKFKTMNDESIFYTEVVVNSCEETVAAIRGLDDSCDLYIVGKGEGLTKPVSSSESNWANFPELGAMGYVLSTYNLLLSNASVLVVHQYVQTSKNKNEFRTSIKHDSRSLGGQRIMHDEDHDN